MGEPKLTFRTVEEFLAWEERQPERYEYAGGVVRLMTGGARGHSVIKVNVVRELSTKLRGGPCQTLDSDFKVRVSANEVRYPDAMVDCTPGQRGDLITATPVLLVEVLSPSSEAVDLSEKAWSYPAIPSLEHYLVLSQTAPRADLWSREGASLPERWARRQFIGLETVVPLPALSIDLKLADLYEGVIFD